MEEKQSPVRDASTPLDPLIASGYKSLLSRLAATDFAKPKLFRLDDPPFMPDIHDLSAQAKHAAKLLVPNTLVSCTITEIDRSHSSGKIKHMTVRLDDFVAFAHNGRYLYEPYEEHKYLYDVHSSHRSPFLDQSAFEHHATQIEHNRSLLFPFRNEAKLIARIEEAKHIYDDHLPPNNCLHQIDSAEVGSNLIALVRDVRLSESAHPPRANISLTLLNSRIAGCKQTALDGSSQFHLLGLRTRPVMPELSTVDQKLAALGLSAYSTIKGSQPIAQLEGYKPINCRKS